MATKEYYNPETNNTGIVQNTGNSRKNENELTEQQLTELFKHVKREVPYGQGQDSTQVVTVEFPSIIGKTRHVKLNEEDNVYMVKLQGEKAKLPVVHKPMEETNLATAHIIWTQENVFFVMANYYGAYHYNPPSRYPDGSDERRKAEEYYKEMGISAEGLNLK